jgi:hypothetical protein
MSSISRQMQASRKRSRIPRTRLLDSFLISRMRIPLILCVSCMCLLSTLIAEADMGRLAVTTTSHLATLPKSRVTEQSELLSLLMKPYNLGTSSCRSRMAMRSMVEYGVDTVVILIVEMYAHHLPEQQVGCTNRFQCPGIEEIARTSFTDDPNGSHHGEVLSPAVHSLVEYSYENRTLWINLSNVDGHTLNINLTVPDTNCSPRSCFVSPVKLREICPKGNYVSIKLS